MSGEPRGTAGRDGAPPSERLAERLPERLTEQRGVTATLAAVLHEIGEVDRALYLAVPINLIGRRTDVSGQVGFSQQVGPAQHAHAFQAVAELADVAGPVAIFQPPQQFWAEAGRQASGRQRRSLGLYRYDTNTTPPPGLIPRQFRLLDRLLA